MICERLLHVGDGTRALHRRGWHGNGRVIVDAPKCLRIMRLLSRRTEVLLKCNTDTYLALAADGKDARFLGHRLRVKSIAVVNLVNSKLNQGVKSGKTEEVERDGSGC